MRRSKILPESDAREIKTGVVDLVLDVPLIAGPSRLIFWRKNESMQAFTRREEIIKSYFRMRELQTKMNDELVCKYGNYSQISSFEIVQ